MAQRRSPWLVVLIAAGTAYGAWKVASALFGDDAVDSVRLANQVWLDRMPRDDRDMVVNLILVERDQRRVGAVARASRWRAQVEGLLWAREGNRVRMHFPQDHKRAVFAARAWNCAGEAPRPFELCLELRRQRDGAPRPLRFYSRKDWVVRPHGDSARALAGEPPFAAALTAAAEAAPADAIVDSGPDTGGPIPLE